MAIRLILRIAARSLAGIMLAYPILLFASATNGSIDATFKYANGLQDGVGLINFGTTEGNVQVTDTLLTGFAWGENLGWINLAPTNGGVHNNGEGILSGYAWGENTGWINFQPTNGGVSIDSSGVFSGFAWSELQGWISFNCSDTSSCGTLNFKVATDWRPASVRQTTPPPPPATSGSGGHGGGGVYTTGTSTLPIFVPPPIPLPVIFPPIIPPQPKSIPPGSTKVPPRPHTSKPVLPPSTAPSLSSSTSSFPVQASSTPVIATTSSSTPSESGNHAVPPLNPSSKYDSFASWIIDALATNWRIVVEGGTALLLILLLANYVKRRRSGY